MLGCEGRLPETLDIRALRCWPDFSTGWPTGSTELFDPGCLQARHVRASGVGARVQRVDGSGRESVRACLVQVQVDVGQRKPGAVGLAARVDGHWRVHHRRCSHLCGDRHILAGRQCLKSGLGGGMARVYRRPSSLRPGEPLGIRAIFGGRDDTPDVDLVSRLLLDNLPRGRRSGGTCRRGRCTRGRSRWSRSRSGNRGRRLQCGRCSGLRRCRRWSHGRDMDLRRPRGDVDSGGPFSRIIRRRRSSSGGDIRSPRRR
jgi:hypothetical protein